MCALLRLSGRLQLHRHVRLLGGIAFLPERPLDVRPVVGLEVLLQHLVPVNVCGQVVHFLLPLPPHRELVLEAAHRHGRSSNVRGWNCEPTMALPCRLRG
eukprot:scaffold125048_cov54-Phaeocystis_antarctica.AAC.1